MHPELTLIAAQQHIADLHRAADHNRLVHCHRRHQPRRLPAPATLAAAPLRSPCPVAQGT